MITWAYQTKGDGIDAIDALVRVERPLPSLSPAQLLVCMSAVALNYRDLLVLNGWVVGSRLRRASRYRTVPRKYPRPSAGWNLQATWARWWWTWRTDLVTG